MTGQCYIIERDTHTERIMTGQCYIIERDTHRNDNDRAMLYY